MYFYTIPNTEDVIPKLFRQCHLPFNEHCYKDGFRFISVAGVAVENQGCDSCGKSVI
jgi:hypothetical protein